MKLVDILARELKVWPEGVAAITQGIGTGVLRDSSHQQFRPEIYLELASDAGFADYQPNSAIVSRAEWQAAVDALNAPKVVEWDGVGDPPVGVDIECTFDSWGYWRKGRVLYYGKQMIFMEQDGESPDDRKFEGSMNPDGIKFRPIRTAEQVAAEEREKAVADLYFTINWSEGRQTWPFISNGRKADYEKAIDAGYRKEPKPCGS